jgi:2,3-bisphosphoglycerate-independent phosphoglycerate mutase
MEFWQALQPRLKHPNIRVATLSGRYYAMDRDKRWDRVEKAWRAMVLADAPRQGTVEAAITASYAEGLDDEFILPVVMEGYTGVQPGDHVLFANFRADRARQLSHALMDPRFDGFARGSATLAWGQKIAMVEYSTVLAGLYDVVLFPPERLSDSLGEVVSRAGLKQFRIAETEKYAHVTFFFNGGKEDLFPGEERKLIPSPKVATYDLQPEMSAPEVTDALVAAIQSGEYALLVVNYANPDMVGHTGNMAAAIKAVECVDHCLARLMEAVDAMGGVLVISADHGNVEQMFDPATNQAHTAHTTGPVPLIVASRALGRPSLANGRLADIAPTLLHLLGLPQPAAMNGRNLLAASSPVQTGKRVHA